MLENRCRIEISRICRPRGPLDDAAIILRADCFLSIVFPRAGRIFLAIAGIRDINIAKAGRYWSDRHDRRCRYYAYMRI